MSSPKPAKKGLEFELMAEIALGGTARVELCRVVAGPRKGQLVAVKRLLAHVADDPQFVDMFRDEVWMTSALHHPHIVEVVAWGEDRQGLWLAVELVRGVSLQRLMKTVFETGERFTERMVVYTARCVCDGLAAAHSLQSSSGEHLNVVHRDLTPGNILLGFDGEVKIADFGLAKAKQRITKTLTGLLKGKPQYMSPEQVQGEHLDGRSDLFALGVILFELFSSRRPWRAKTDLDAMRAITDDAAEDLQQLAPKIDRALVEIVHRALEKDPASRYQTALELRHRFDEWLMAHGYRDGNAQSLGRFVRRNAMRQMRWFARAAAGEMADQARVEQRVRIATRPAAPQLPLPPPAAPAAPPPAAPAAPTTEAEEPDSPWPDDDDGPTLVKRSDTARQHIRTALRKARPPKRKTSRSSDTIVEPSTRAARHPTDELPTVPGSKPPPRSVYIAKQASVRARKERLGAVAPPDPSVPPPPVASTAGKKAVSTPPPGRSEAGLLGAAASVSPNETITRVAGDLAVPPVPVPAYPSFTALAPKADFNTDAAAQALRLAEAARAAAADARLAADRAHAAGHAAIVAARAINATSRGDLTAGRNLLMDAVRIDMALQRGDIPVVPSLPPRQPDPDARSERRTAPKASIPGTAVSGVHGMPTTVPPPPGDAFAGAFQQLVGLAGRREGALLLAGLALAMLTTVVVLAWLFS